MHALQCSSDRCRHRRTISPELGSVCTFIRHSPDGKLLVRTRLWEREKAQSQICTVSKIFINDSNRSSLSAGREMVAGEMSATLYFDIRRCRVAHTFSCSFGLTGTFLRRLFCALDTQFNRCARPRVCVWAPAYCQHLNRHVSSFLRVSYVLGAMNTFGRGHEWDAHKA